jgi:hypothetical protein
LTAKASFACARGAGGGASRLRRLEHFNFEMLLTLIGMKAEKISAL